MRSPLRTRLRAGVALISMLGAALAGDGASAHHADEVTGHDPAAYGEPHAGWTAPSAPRGRLAPVGGTLFGTHSEDSHSGALTRADQHILETEEALGFTMHINNSYYGDFAEIADHWDPARQKPLDMNDPSTWENRGLSKLAFWDVKNGRIPLVGWGCASSSAVTRGSLDATIRKTAEAMKAFGHEFFMRYCWEMDGDKRGEPGSAAQFTAAWIHIYDIFREVGADNVVWVWCANANSFKHRTSSDEWAWDYYPGDEYVDWVSADGYNWGVSKRNSWGDGSRDRWRGLVEIFDEFMVWARAESPDGQDAPVPDNLKYYWGQNGYELGSDDNRARDATVPERFPRKKVRKPIMIGEYAAQDASPEGLDPRKPQWMRDAHDAVNGDKPRTAECPHCGVYSDIGALVYFDINADAEHENGDWRILSSPASVEATVESVSNEAWYRNSIHTTGWAPAAARSDRPATLPPVDDPADPPAGSGGTPADPPATPVDAKGSGYWMVGADGKVYAFGDAGHHGNPGVPTGTVAVDLEPTPSGNGYWVVDAAGHVFAFGDAVHHGAVTSGLAPDERVTSLSATPTGTGYWIFTTKGKVLTFGDAKHHGDMSKATLNGPVLDSIPTATGRGYYMVASDGGIFAFGDAMFYGSMGDKKLNAPVQSLVPDPDAKGYWLVASDGGIFAFEAPFRGSMGAQKLNKPVTGMVPFGNGYLMVGEDGGVFNFSDRDFLGSLGDRPPAVPIVSVAALER